MSTFVKTFAERLQAWSISFKSGNIKIYSFRCPVSSIGTHIRLVKGPSLYHIYFNLPRRGEGVSQLPHDRTWFIRQPLAGFLSTYFTLTCNWLKHLRISCVTKAPKYDVLCICIPITNANIMCTAKVVFYFSTFRRWLAFFSPLVDSHARPND